MTSVSVVIPCYNAAPFLRESLDSVWQQTHTPMEVIVVDDGSTDASVAIAESYEPAVRVRRQNNQGPSAARNRGMEEARGDWIAFIDADDLWKPTKLERQLQVLGTQSDVVCVHTGYYVFGLRDDLPETPKAVVNDDYRLETLLLDPLVNTSAALVRRDTEVSFPEWSRDSEDTIYFAELARLGRFLYVPERLVGYRAHEVQQHRKTSHLAASVQSRLTWVQRNASSLGSECTRKMNALLQAQLIQDMMNAFWNRDWKTYWAIQRFACTLDWEGDPPEVLSKRIYPPIAYAFKDVFDKLRSSPRKS